MVKGFGPGSCYFQDLGAVQTRLENNQSDLNPLSWTGQGLQTAQGPSIGLTRGDQGCCGATLATDQRFEVLAHTYRYRVSIGR